MPNIPPDRQRCQAEVRAPHSFMQLGPAPRFERCSNTPVTIATEVAEPRGSMSLCAECWAACMAKMPGRVTYHPILPADKSR